MNIKIKLGRTKKPQKKEQLSLSTAIRGFKYGKRIDRKNK